MTPAEASREVLERALGLGFALAGIARAHPSAHAGALREWLAEGRHADMAWLADRVEERLDPRRYLDGARSIVLVADVYASRGDADTGRARHGRIARYARGGDYHEVMKRRLHVLADGLRAAYPEARTACFVDTAPVLEREHAARAGLGWVAKNSLLINPRLGSYLLLGGMMTTLELEATGSDGADHCGTCTRCIDACPTGAITPYRVDASRCVSYLTIEHRRPIAGELHSPIGDWLFGCDICQEVCPHNSAHGRGAAPAPAHPAYEPRRDGFDVLQLLGWDVAQRREAVRGTALTRARLEMLRRNALIVAGNLARAGDEPALVARIEAIAADAGEAPLVRETAVEVLRRLRGGAPATDAP